MVEPIKNNSEVIYDVVERPEPPEPTEEEEEEQEESYQ